MKTFNKSQFTKGFFDLGISLLILAIGGTTTYVQVSAHNDEIAKKAQMEPKTFADSERKTDL